jgi:hypothetical protein
VCKLGQSSTRVKPFICTMPMRMDEGWNQIQFNLSDFTRRAYGTNYVETLRVQVHANCRIRRIYFSDRLYSEEELPPEFKLFLPIQVSIQQASFCLQQAHSQHQYVSSFICLTEQEVVVELTYYCCWCRKPERLQWEGTLTTTAASILACTLTVGFICQLLASSPLSFHPTIMNIKI